MSSGNARALTGAVLFLAGAAVFAAALAGYLQGPLWQKVHAEEVLKAHSLPATPSTPRAGSPLARLRIPRMELDVTVIEGTRPADLLKAPGHLPGSAVPGESENCIIAGHRDLHFSRLGTLRTGDRVELESAEGIFAYRVESARIVEPSDDAVLQAGSDALLTLITCYPFRYVGAAPQRYVVVARLAESRNPSSSRARPE